MAAARHRLGGSLLYALSLLLGVGIGFALAAILASRRRARLPGEAAAETDAATKETSTHDARERRLEELEARCIAQMDFFLNFPEVVKSLTAALSLDQVLNASSRGVTALLQTRRVALLLADPSGELHFADGLGLATTNRDASLGSSKDLGLVDALAQHGVAHIDEEATRAILRDKALPSEWIAPIRHANQLFGAILVERASGEAEDIQRVLAMLADLTGVGLQSATKVTQMKRDAEHDALTGLPNRRALFRHLENELERCRAYGTALSLAVIDVDHFKQYNDRNGHQAGDLLLASVAETLRNHTRQTDLVARYGGEEFVIVLAGADRDQAFRQADRVRKAIADEPFMDGVRQPLGCMSISAGVATFHFDALEASTLLNAADKALYRAKALGRNRVVQYSSPLANEAASEHSAIAEEPRDTAPSTSAAPRQNEGENREREGAMR